MRCAEAQKQINRTSIKSDKTELGQDVLERINHCVACASLWEAQSICVQDMDVLSEQVLSGKLDFDSFRSKILSRQRQSEDKKMRKEKSSWYSGLITSRPKLSISLATVAILILITVLAPFKFSDPVGYEIAIAGVNRDLIDSGEIEKALNEAGLSYAKVEFANCAPECVVTVSNLISGKDIETAKETVGHLKEVHFRKPFETYVDKKSGGVITRSTWSSTDNSREGVFEKEITYNGEDTQKLSIDIKSLTKDTILIWTEWYHNGDDSSEGMTNELIVRPDGSSSESMISNPSFQWFRAKDTWNYDSTRKLISHIITDTLGIEHKINVHDWSKQEQQYRDVGAYYYMVYREDGTPALAGMNSDPAKEGLDIPNLAEGMYLKQNDPNPFNTETNIIFKIPEASHVKITIYKFGELVRTLVDKEMKAGEHKIKWDCKDDNGEKQWAWRFICKIEVGEYYHAISMAQVSYPYFNKLPTPK